ncbi:MAG TPA: PhoX family phosphatase [Microvirga sp.]|nr:PhoX family phosphatase [Microvirga sp.]
MKRQISPFEPDPECGEGACNASQNPTFGEVIGARFNRRDLLQGALAVTAISAIVAPRALAASERAHGRDARPFAFKEVAAGVDERHHVAEGYDADILIRWGDPVLADAPAFDPQAQAADKQRRQFGYNNDFLGYFPLEGSQRGLLVVNHEYTDAGLMFPGVGTRADVTRALADIEIAAHGGSVLEVRRENGKWGVVARSAYARRITADTAMDITGPAAGHERMKTSADPDGRRVLGMLFNCAGGVTPWGTWLSCEENVNGYFSGTLGSGDPEASNHERYGVPSNRYAWGQWHDRFDIGKEPNEPNRFGWVVEIDPFDPTSVPKKRTAMGRFKHEGAAGITNKDGRYVVYSGDDGRFEYIYKFVTRGSVNPGDRRANMDLLDDGTLYVGTFNDDGTGEWRPLVHGHGPLTAANGFRSQADVVIEARRAADLLGATKMDRPEDIEANPRTNKVYAMLTNNDLRSPDQVDAANPRPANAFGHIVEMTPDDLDHAGTTFRWEILVQCGDPSVAAVGATFSSATTQDGWFGMPDNCAIDNLGRLWIATDGNSEASTRRSDGVWALETEGALRGTSRHFFRCPVGAELSGPVFTPDVETMFVAVQHPGAGGPDWPAFGRPSTFEDPSTRWPDFTPGMPPRPSIVVITRRGGGKIGL